jgi:hypothetical protein
VLRWRSSLCGEMRQKEASGDGAGVGVSGIVVLAVDSTTTMLSSLHSSIRISPWPVRYQLLVSMKPGQHNLKDGHKYCTGPVYGQGTRREETDNASTYLDHRESLES